MKNIYQLLLCFAFLSLTSTNVFAQAQYSVSGVITNEKGEPVKGATVFIGGSEREMATGENGQFNFSNLPTGTFQLSVQMLGYAPETRNIIVKGAPIKIDIQLQTKVIALQQVTIGKRKASEKNLALFKEKFLGQSANAKQCIIINPEVINFSTKKGQLLADADEFLVIENKRLGYRLRYLLGGFSYTHADGIIVYHGECSFEELDGTDEQKKKWTRNRLTTYRGSFMHFLRSVYANNTLENGFITKPVYGYGTLRYDNTTIQLHDRIIINDRLISFDSLLTAIDTNFTSLKFRQELYVTYDPKLAAHFKPNRTDLQANIIIDPMGSVLRLTTNQAIIDKKGSYTDYHDFLSQGYWATARVGDQLPVEYKPPVADIPRRVTPINPLLVDLQKWTDSIPQEKAYLHLDKPYYVPGDTIWFKGYLTTGSRHRLSALSGAVYIDLINELNQPVKTLKLPVDSGTVAGDLILSYDIKEGSYHIRAYTQWMRNAGEDYFFNKAITIGDPRTFKDKTNPKPSLQQTDVQFFPESGNLVNGIASRVGFKAVGANGLGVPISGTITDNENNELARINTSHAGMGVFLLKPLPGKNYIAHIKFADSTTKDIPLHRALNEGYVLNVYQPNRDSILVRIQASVDLLHSTVNLIAHSNGEVIFTSPVEINGAMSLVWLDKKSFPSGIAQFTIFNTKNEPLNERIAFIKNDDYMQIAIKTEKALYKSKEHVQLELSAKESTGTPVAANFSVAVIDESKVPADESAESTIFSNILLSSDIKGYIERPNYYFTADTNDVNKALDNLMLTQGYRRFEWKLLDSIVNTKPVFKAEGLTTTISGVVKTLGHQPLPNAHVILVSMNARISKETTADVTGRFRFDKLLFPDSAKFAVQARDLKNTDKTIIILDSIPQLVTNKKQNVADVDIIKANLQKAQQEGKPAQLTGLHVLKQVDIKTTRNKIDKDIAVQGMYKLPDEESADKILTIPDPEHYNDLEMFLQGRLGNVRIQLNPLTGYKELVSSRPPTDLLSNPNPQPDLVSVYLNGRPLSVDEFNDILIGSLQPEDVSKILLVTHNLAMINLFADGSKPSGGMLFIITKSVTTRKQYNPGIANLTPKGYNRVRQFYSPRYDRPDGEHKQPDLRTTIYWNPYVNTDQTGKATVDFYNADGPGMYRVVVEGINGAGELGRQVYRYKVE
jgi:hypothetical protein